MIVNSINSPQPIISFNYATYATQTSTASAIPIDNTIPQKAEGTEIMTVTMTPSTSTNLIFIKAGVNTSATYNIGLAIFQDATNDALSASVGDCVFGHETITCAYTGVAASINARTYKSNYGKGVANTSINAVFGGVMISYMYVEEYLLL